MSAQTKKDLIAFCRVFQLSHGGSKPVPTYNTTWKPRPELTDAKPQWRFVPQKPRQLLISLHFPVPSLCSVAPTLCSAESGVGAVQSALRLTRLVGVGDEVTGLQAIRLIQSANIRSPVFTFGWYFISSPLQHSKVGARAGFASGSLSFITH